MRDLLVITSPWHKPPKERLPGKAAFSTNSIQILDIAESGQFDQCFNGAGKITLTMQTIAIAQFSDFRRRSMGFPACSLAALHG
jgi:hypothetical protein